MGGKSSSSSSSSTTQTTENYDQRVAVESDGVGIGANSPFTIEVTDLGVVQGTADVLTEVIAFTGSALSGVVDGFTEVTQSALETTAEASEDDAKELAQLVIKVGAALAAAIALAAIFFRKG